VLGLNLLCKLREKNYSGATSNVVNKA
jgi:hypothetical protein